MGLFFLLFFYAFCSFSKESLPPALRYLSCLPSTAHYISPNRYGYYKDRITHGRMLFERLTVSTIKTPKSSVDHFNEIVALAWALYDCAVEKYGGFYDGTIVIRDPDAHIYNFFHTYAHSMWGNSRSQPRYITTRCYGYPRYSSHFPEEPGIQWGIDMRCPEKKILEPLLPTGKRHILFGRLSQGRTFIKFEENGLCLQDGSAVAHGIGYIRSVARKVTATNDGIHTRREDIPHWVCKKYRKIYHKAHQSGILITKNPHSISAIFSDLQKLIHQSDLKKIAEKFIKTLNKSFDHLSLRRGNEVIL